MATRRETTARKISLRNEMLAAGGTDGEPVMLPPVRELAQRHGLSNRAVHLEMQTLVSEGAVYTVPRVGTFVAPQVRNKNRNTSGVAARASENAVFTVISQGDGDVMPGHQQFGWADHLTWGVMRKIRSLQRHAMVLELDRLLERGFDELGTPPSEAIICGYSLGDPRVGKLIGDLVRRRTKVVVYGDEEKNCDRMTSDHEAGAYDLARWLIRSGRRRILFIHYPIPATRWLEARYAGYRRALTEAGLTAMPPVVYPHPLPDTDEEGRISEADFRIAVQMAAEVLRPHLTGKHSADALMMVTDGEVPCVAAACRACGRKPNEDVALVGYDNYWRDSMSLFPEPFAPMATVDKFNRELGAGLVDLLVERLEGRLPAEPQRRVITPGLVEISSP